MRVVLAGLIKAEMSVRHAPGICRPSRTSTLLIPEVDRHRPGVDAARAPESSRSLRRPTWCRACRPRACWWKQSLHLHIVSRRDTRFHGCTPKEAWVCIWVAHARSISIATRRAPRKSSRETTTHPEVLGGVSRRPRSPAALSIRASCSVDELARAAPKDLSARSTRCGWCGRDAPRPDPRMCNEAVRNRRPVGPCLLMDLSICNAIPFAHSTRKRSTGIRAKNVVLGAFGECAPSSDLGAGSLESDKEEATLQPVDITASASVH